MKRYNDITPPTDLTNSREYYGMYNSRDFYRGTSFKMSGEWAPNTHYFNDEYIVDFVSYQGALLSCVRGHISTSDGGDVPKLVFDGDKIIGIKPNAYWAFVMSGSTGPEGKVWIPSISSDGVISWELEKNTLEAIPSINIKGPKGDKGDTPKVNVIKQDNKYYWTSDGVLVVDPVTKDPIPAQGPIGKTGDPGKVYIPDVVGENMVFTLSSEPVNSTISVPLATFKGENGKTPLFTLSEDGNLYYFYQDDKTLRPLGSIKGPKGDKGDKGDQGIQGKKGDKGDKGNAGPVQELRIGFDSSNGMSVLYCRTKGTSEWTLLGPVGGTPGKSPKLIREKGDPNLREDDRILWGYDGVPVSEWTTLCYLEELRGDENIAYGCPSDFEGGAPSIEKIWYDPCDDAIDRFSITDFLYQAYLSIGGTLNKSDFENAFSNLSNISGFEVKFAKNFESLGEPTKDKLGKLWLIPSTKTETNNLFDEYIVVHSPSTIDDTYMWEKWGSETISVDLSNYYTKSEVDNIKKELEDKIVEISSTIWNDVNI